MWPIVLNKSVHWIRQQGPLSIIFILPVPADSSLFVAEMIEGKIDVMVL